ncbi:MAG: hypothetical protein KGS61_02235, partial [Verrucomicrobia bacterium]|nr:hypothetical protein [Verrucomicrobiota bacterium]
MKRITLKRIYQGKVSEVQIPDAKGEWKKLDDGESALWQHHQLFQDAVNYYSVCLAALADGAPGWAGEYAAQVQGTEKGKWDDFTKKGEKRNGLRKSLARTLGIPEQDASFLVCRSRILAGCEAPKDLLHQVVQELFPEKKGRGTIQHAGVDDWPMLCWDEWVGESKAEKKARKEIGVASFLDALFRAKAN